MEAVHDFSRCVYIDASLNGLEHSGHDRAPEYILFLIIKYTNHYIH